MSDCATPSGMPMIGWSRPALGRRSRRARTIVLAVLVLGAAVLLLTPTHEVRERARRFSARTTTTATTHAARRRRSLVSAAQITRARRVARRFLAAYLPF